MARGSGERFSSPSGSGPTGRSPAAKRYLVNFKLKILPIVATKLTNFRSFSGNKTSTGMTGWPSGNILDFDFRARLLEVWRSNPGGENEICLCIIDHRYLMLCCCINIETVSGPCNRVISDKVNQVL